MLQFKILFCYIVCFRVLWMDIKKYQRKRLSAIGRDNGELVVSVCDIDTNSKFRFDVFFFFLY